MASLKRTWTHLVFAANLAGQMHLREMMRELIACFASSAVRGVMPAYGARTISV
jgi:hypothetical protein